MKNKVNNKGFTLIEILVVVVIIGILAAIILANVAVVKKSRDAQRKSDLYKIQTAFEQYKADNGEYPLPVGNNIPANCNSGSSFGNAPDCTIIYLSKIPIDPNGSGWPWNGGNYLHIGGSESYILYACIENTSDPERYLMSNVPPYNLCPGRNGYRVFNQ